MGVTQKDIAKTSQAVRPQLSIETLKLNPMFAKLSDPALRSILKSSRIIKFSDGDRIISRGDEMRYSGVILSGGVRNSITSAEGYELSMSILMRGAHYGSVGILEPTPSPWDCFAHGPTELLGNFNTDFRTAMEQFPEITVMLAKLLSYRAQKAYAVMSNVALESLESRLCRTLIMLAGQPGASENEVPEIAITQESLGHFVQCTRPTVNKALKDLERAGVVKIGYSTIRILDMGWLQDKTNGETVYVF